MRGFGSRRIGRLRRRADFLAAASGSRFHTARVTLQGRARASECAPDLSLRLGFTVTKRVGHATERNRIRRRLRAAALDAGLADADMPLDLVVVARRDALTAAYDDLVEDLRRALHAVRKPRRPKERPPLPSTAGGHAGDGPGGTA